MHVVADDRDAAVFDAELHDGMGHPGAVLLAKLNHALDAVDEGERSSRGARA